MNNKKISTTNVGNTKENNYSGDKNFNKVDTASNHKVDTIKIGGKDQYLVNMTLEKAKEMKKAMEVSPEETKKNKFPSSWGKKGNPFLKKNK